MVALPYGKSGVGGVINCSAINTVRQFYPAVVVGGKYGKESQETRRKKKTRKVAIEKPELKD